MDNLNRDNLISGITEMVTNDPEKFKDFIIFCIEEEIIKWITDDLRDFLFGKVIW